MCSGFIPTGLLWLLGRCSQGLDAGQACPCAGWAAEESPSLLPVFKLDWNIDTSMEEKILTQSSLEPLQGLPQCSWGGFMVPSKSNHSMILRRAPLMHKSLPRIRLETPVLVPVCVFIVFCYKSVEF